MSDATKTMGKPLSGVGQAVSYTGTAGTSTSMPVGTSIVRIIATTDCFVAITIAGTAAVANTGVYLPALTAEYFPIDDGEKVSAIQVSAAGTIYISPMV